MIKTDLKQIREYGEFNDKNVRKNLKVLFEFCDSKGKDFLFKTFGESYSIKDPISWRYKELQEVSPGKFKEYFIWFAEWMIKNDFKSGKCSIKNTGNDIEVNNF